MSRQLSLIFLALMMAVAVDAAPLKRALPSGPTQHVTPAPTGRIIVKFRESSGVKVLDGGALAGPAKSRSQAVRLLSDAAPGARVTRRFTRAATELGRERREAEARSGLSLPDLTTYAELDPGLDPDDLDGLERIVRALRADPSVETAFLEPRMVPAAIGFDAFTGTFTPPERRGEAAAPQPDKTTADYTSLQGYKDNVQGVHALAVAGLPGADGAGIKVVDIEGAWKWDHEDLPAPFLAVGGQLDDLSWRNHGTAVLGEIRGDDNGYGVTGIAAACEVGCSSIAEQSLADALNSAAANIDVGDVILIELHAPGPNSYGEGQFGYVAMEYWQDNFDAILLATAAGRIVVEAAGNGQQDFDDAVYGDLFDPTFRHSGAIMVGAGDASSDPEWFTNHGVRVDLNGWGSDVTTLGYGDLQGDPAYPETEWYTSYFSGTSSASPIVVGAVVSLQGLVKSRFGTVLDAYLMRDLLVANGTPQAVDPWLIGPRPNIEAAWAVAEAGIGVIAGTVTEAGGGAPVEGVLVAVQGSARSTVTDASGSYSMGMLAGPATLEFSEYFYQDASVSGTVVFDATTTLNASLSPWPSVSLSGAVTDDLGAPVSGARVTALGAPLSVAASAGDGSWAIPGAVAGRTLNLLIDGVPGLGAEYLTVTPYDAGGGVYPVYPELRTTAQPFTNIDGWFDVGGLWSHGTPTTGPGAAWSPDSCWGVGMDANYPDSSSGWLQSPSFTFSSGDRLHLSLHTWSGVEDGYDGAVLRIKGDADWVVLEPMGGYPSSSLTALADGPGWSGQSGGWVGSVFDVSAWIGQTFTLSFLFTSDSGVNDVGFFIDDLTFDDGYQVVAVEDLAPAPPGGPVVTNHPNPFNPATNVRWRVESPGAIDVSVHDARGRMVRTLLRETTSSTSGVIRWDGRDDAGRALPTGTYLVRVRDAAGRSSTSRATLLK